MYVIIHSPSARNKLILSLYGDRLPNIMVNRLFLNLRSFDRSRHGLSSNTTSLPEPAFAHDRPNRILGNIGEPVDYDQWDDFMDELHEESEGGEELTELSGVRDPETTLVPVVSTYYDVYVFISYRSRCSRCTKRRAKRVSRWCACAETLSLSQDLLAPMR